MEQEYFEQLFEELDKVQDEAMAKEEQYEGMPDDKNKLFYFLGKDVGIARAKDIIRRTLEEYNEGDKPSFEVQESFTAAPDRKH